MSPQRLSVNEIIRRVRARIVTRRVLQGIAITFAVAAVTLIGASILANKFSHKQALLIVLRIVPLILTIAAAWWFVFRALRQKISDTQIARLVEEKFSLDDRVTTSVEFAEHTRDASPAIVNRLVRDTDERISQTDLNRVVDPRHAYAYGAGALAIFVAMIAALWWLAPVKGGVSALYSPFETPVSANAMFINVTPATSRVPRGSDQKLKATLNGFDTNVAQVFIRKLNDANWLATAMEPAKNKGDFQHVIFNIQDSIVFYVEANGIRSTEQTLEVVDLPYVKQIDLVLNFPAFAGMPAKKIENGGDVAALKGTVVRVTAILSAKAKGARIILSDGSKIEMTTDFEMTTDNEFHFVGQFTVKDAGTYKIELTSEDGERYNGSNEFDITLLEDMPPSVVIDKPGRDMKVTNIQEVFTQAKAEDDFGVSAIEFFYTVNGGEEKRVQLQDLKRDEPKTLTGAHTFFLEEMNLQVGDFISYYAKAKDVTGHESTSDIYFLEIRPFDREFRQSQQQGGQGGQGEQDSNALTKKQREIIAATFRVQREEKQYTPPERDENYGAVALSQEKLKSEAEALVDRIRRRLGATLNSDPKFSKLVEYISQATTEMGSAKDKLHEKNTKDALPPEQRALQQLLKAEALNREIQVGQQQSQGGQGGQQDQKELADLFELQLDKMKNQYETVQRQQQQAQSEQQDELARKLQELAQRQQKELEQRMRSQMQQQGSGSGASQRQQQEMIEEAQRMARELERLSRDRRDPKMQQAAEQMRQAAEEMKRAQSLSSSSQSQAAQAEAAAQTQRALQRMEQAKRMMNSSQQAGGQQSVQQLRQRAEEAMRKQNDISKSVDEMAKNGQASATADKKQQLAERKETLAEQMSGLEKDIDQAARGMGADKQQASDKLRDAANAIRRNRIPDRIKQNKQLIDNGYFAQAGEREKIIKDNIEEVLKNLQAAESGANRRPGEGMEDALSRARELTENLESLRKKMEQGNSGSQENKGQNQSGQQAGQQQNGQQGRQGQQQGRQGQQGQQGSQQGQQAGNQQNGQQQGGQQQGNQRGQQGGQQGSQQARGQQGGQQQGQQGSQQQGGQQQGQQAGGQQSGQQQGGQQARNQQGSRQQRGQQGQQGSQQSGQQQGGQQQGGQQGQQGGQQGQQQGGQQGQQGGQQGQQAGGQQGGGQQQGGQQGGGQQAGGRQQGGRQQGGRQSEQPGQQSGEQQTIGGGGPPRTAGNQTASELQERMNEAQELRRALRGNNDLIRDLDKAMEQLRRINPNAFDDPAQMALLKSEVIDPLRQLEVELARRLQGKLDNQGIGSLSDGDAPDRYRKLIEEYYRRLSSRSAGNKQ
jgi:hypothetical protein